MKTINPYYKLTEEKNPNKTDIVLATVGHARRYDKKIENVRRVMQAEKNEPFRCEKCGEWVRLGARGGLFDLRKRTLHSKVCGSPEKRTPEELEQIRASVKQSHDQSSDASFCKDCEFKIEYCKC